MPLIGILSEQLELEIDGEQIQYLGEVSHEQKVQESSCYPVSNHLARAVWFSDRINGKSHLGWDWPVPEIIAHGKTGFVCDSLEND